MENSRRTIRGQQSSGIKKALDQGHLKRPSGQPIQIRLHDQVREKRLWPTPNASDHRDRGNLSDPAIQRRIKLGKQVGLTMAVKEHKGSGTLNPTWVEWLMGVQGRIYRLKGLGNSIVPQIAEEIGQAIMKVELDSD